MNLVVFFDSVRASIFNGSLSHKQVQGCEILLAAMAAREWGDLRWYAYVLATTYHETDATMQPVAEYKRGKGKPYGKPDPETGQTYYGRLCATHLARELPEDAGPARAAAGDGSRPGAEGRQRRAHHLRRYGAWPFHRGRAAAVFRHLDE